MNKGFEGLFDILMAGFESLLNLPMIVAFCVLILVLMSYLGRLQGFVSAEQVKAESFWGFFSALSSFLLVAVYLFLLNTPLTLLNLESVFAWGLNMGQFMSLLGLLGWLFLIPLMYMPIKVKDNPQDDDLSAMPFVGVFFGYCLAVMCYIGIAWPESLVKVVGSTEVVGQAAFYGVVFVLPVVVVWGLLSFIFVKVLGPTFNAIVPRVLPLALLLTVFVFQLVAQYL